MHLCTMSILYDDVVIFKLLLLLLFRPLSMGVKVIAAHCATEVRELQGLGYGDYVSNFQ